MQPVDTSFVFGYVTIFPPSSSHLFCTPCQLFLSFLILACISYWCQYFSVLEYRRRLRSMEGACGIFLVLLHNDDVRCNRQPSSVHILMLQYHVYRDWHCLLSPTTIVSSPFTLTMSCLQGLARIDTSNPMEPLLFGALISAVDPVATLSIMGSPELNCDPLLYR